VRARRLVACAVVASLLAEARGQTQSQVSKSAKVAVKPTPVPTPRPRSSTDAARVKTGSDLSRSGGVSIKPSPTPTPRPKFSPGDSVRVQPGPDLSRSSGVYVKPSPVPTKPIKHSGQDISVGKPPASDTSRVGKGSAAGAATSAAVAGAASAGGKLGSTDLLRQARYAQVQGDLPAASRVYKDAREAAKTEKSPKLEAQAALQYAQTIQSLDKSQLTTDRISEAKTAYSDAIRLGTPEQRVQAQNDMAVLSLREGDSRQAVATLRDVDVNTLAPDQRNLYTYNYGRALELSGNGQEAYQKYTQALERDPGFDLAADGAFRVLRASKPPRVADTARLAETLLEKGRPESAVRQIRGALGAWRAEPEAPKLLAVLVGYYAAARIEPREFGKTEWPGLSKLSGEPRLAPPIKEIGLAYSGPMPVFVERESARRYFPAWAEEPAMSRPFSRLLKSIGDSYGRADQQGPALARYSAAWSLDPSNTDAALYAAMVLRDSEGLDPGGRLRDRLVESAVEEKAAAYQKQDWVNVLRQRVLLATIFEKEEKWGPRTNPKSAIYQWTSALKADEQVRQRDPNFPLSPGIYLHLGVCHERVGDPSLAWSAYTKAAYAFLKASKPEDAAKALDRARATSKSATPQQLETVKALEDALARSRRGGER